MTERHYLNQTEKHFRRAIGAKPDAASEAGARGATGGANMVQQVVPQPPAETGSKSHGQQKTPDNPGLLLTDAIVATTGHYVQHPLGESIQIL